MNDFFECQFFQYLDEEISKMIARLQIVPLKLKVEQDFLRLELARVETELGFVQFVQKTVANLTIMASSQNEEKQMEINPNFNQKMSAKIHCAF